MSCEVQENSSTYLEETLTVKLPLLLLISSGRVMVTLNFGISLVINKVLVCLFVFRRIYVYQQELKIGRSLCLEIKVADLCHVV